MSGVKTPYIISIVYLLLAGCASTPVAGVPTITSTTPGPTDYQTAVQAAPSPNPVAETPTPRPSPRPTATLANVPLVPEGPWLVFSSGYIGGMGSDYLWAINEDGTGLKKLVDEPVATFEARPKATLGRGATIAYVAYDEKKPDYTLKLLSLPDGKVTPITSLIKDAAGIDTFNLLEALNRDGVKWSPDGGLLAFVAAMGGSSANVYIYNLASGAVTQVSDQPSYAYNLNWSPDGRYLVYEGFKYLGMAGPESVGVWAVRADGTGTSSLFTGDDRLRGEVYYEGWNSATEITLVNRIVWGEDASGSIRIVDVETGEADVLLKTPIADTAFAPEHNTWLLATSYSLGSDQPLVLYRQGQRQEIPGKGITNVEWLSTYDVFVGQTAEGVLYVIAPDGEMTSLPMGQDWFQDNMRYYRMLSTSPDEQTWAWYMPDLWIGKPMAEPVKVLPDTSSKDPAQSNPINVSGVAWSPDSEWMIVLSTGGLYRVELSNLEVVRITREVMEFWYGDIFWGATWIH